VPNGQVVLAPEVTWTWRRDNCLPLQGHPLSDVKPMASTVYTGPLICFRSISRKAEGDNLFYSKY
jgi:hypothetical protein